MRVLPSVGAAAVAVAATVLLAPAAYAHGNAPGDNGTIKIHDAKTGAELVKNEPHVCTFYLDGFFFDGRQQADWRILEKPPTASAKDKLVLSDAITLDSSGHGRTADMTLPDGHYKLEWNFDGENGKAKQKVFWVDCPAQGGSSSGGSSSGGSSSGGSSSGGSTTGGSTTGGSTTGGTTGGSTTGTSGGSTSGGTTGTPTGTPSTTPAAADSKGSTGTPSGGNLAETGASVLGLSAAAVALLAIGGTIVFRRRGGRQH